MNNFYYSSDYDLFKKALRTTKNEPVVINILSDDSSLREDGSADASSTVVRKQMSSKFQASPFDKFFGPKKKRTDPLDMKDFSSWKNKNFRESEKRIDKEASEGETKRFSFADYLNSKAKTERYNDDDKVKSELQKPIDQLSSDEETYKKFSLDSYLNKLEQERKARKDFMESEDLIDIDMSQNVMDDLGNQDENFTGASDVDVEDFAYSGDVAGERFAFEREELDSVRARLDKMEREANNIKDKPTTKVISTEEINEIKGKTDDDDDEFNLDKLGIEDDIERVNSKINSLNQVLQTTGDGETETPKVEHKRFMEINKNFDENAEESAKDAEEKNESDLSEQAVEGVDGQETEESQEGVVEPELIDDATNNDDVDEQSEDAESVVDELEIPEEYDEENLDEENSDEEKSTIKKTDYLTRSDFKDFTEEIVNKFSELYRGTAMAGRQSMEQGDGYMQGLDEEYPQQPYGADGYTGQNDLQAQINELIEQSKKSDMEVAEKLRLAELEKERVQREYEEKLQALQTSMEQRDEEAKQQAYIEKLKNDIKFKKSENSFLQREEEIREHEKLSSQKQFAGERLKTELKNSLSVSNLEMDKKLLESVAKLHASRGIEIDTEIKEEPVKVEESAHEVEEKEVSEQTRTPRQRARNRSTRTTRRRTSTVSSRMRTRTPRRKIDSDIIGGINFD